MDSRAEARRQKRLEYNRKYRVDKATEIQEQRKQKITCECGMEVSRRHLAEHQSKNLHKKEMEKRQQVLEARTNPDIAKLIMSFV